MNKKEVRDDLQYYKQLIIGALLMEYAKNPEKFKEELMGFFVDFEGSAGIPALQLRNLGILELSSIANTFTQEAWDDVQAAAWQIKGADYSEDREQETIDFLNALKELDS